MVTSRRFACAKEGVRDKDKRDHNIKNPRAETRCGCEAHLVIILNRDSKKYVVSEFIAEHNHYPPPINCAHDAITTESGCNSYY